MTLLRIVHLAALGCTAHALRLHAVPSAAESLLGYPKSSSASGRGSAFQVRVASSLPRFPNNYFGSGCLSAR